MNAPFLSDSEKYHKKAAVNSVAAGTLFGVGWVLFIDSVFHTKLYVHDGWAEVAIQASPLLSSSLVLLLLNLGLAEVDALRESLYSYDSQSALPKAKAWVCFCATLAVGAAILSLVVLMRAHTYQGPSETVVAGSGTTGTSLIVASGLLFWVGRGHSVSSM